MNRKFRSLLMVICILFIASGCYAHAKKMFSYKEDECGPYPNNWCEIAQSYAKENLPRELEGKLLYNKSLDLKIGVPTELPVTSFKRYDRPGWLVIVPYSTKYARGIYYVVICNDQVVNARIPGLDPFTGISGYRITIE